MEEWVHKYVVNSNLIEDIEEQEGPEYDNHIIMTQYVYEEAKNGHYITPERIHSGLMRGILHDTRDLGAYRRCPVWVGGELAPDPMLIFRLMEDLDKEVYRYLDTGKDMYKYPTVIWNFHYHFECIHPFLDGNGRTGRLMLNSIFVIMGREWNTFENLDRNRYYFRIREYYKRHFLYDNYKTKEE